MLEGLWIFVLCVVLNGASSQTLDYLMPTTQNPATYSSWDELLPALKLIKSSSSIKKERLLNVVKVIKFLLADEIEKNQCDKLLEDIKGTNEYQVPEMPDIDSLVEERLGPISDAIDGKPCIKNVEIPQNNTADLSKILAKISTALAKVKERNELAEAKNLPIVTKKTECNDKAKSSQAVMKLKSSDTKFNIPCQRAKDILEETATFKIPKDAYCDLPANINLDSILKNPKLNSDKFKTIPNSISCVDSDDSIAILFRPKKISLMQVYGNLLKKITITVLVPYHVSKMAL